MELEKLRTFCLSLPAATEDISGRMICALVLAQKCFVLVNDPSKVKPKEVETLVHQSHGLVAAKLTKKLRIELGLS
jgi:predicted DNA-binding protein (MmcQ/YjbR family)